MNSNGISAFWSGLSRSGRALLIGGTALGMALVMWGAFVAFHEEYSVLFSDLAQADAAVIVERLKKDKVSYRLGAGGTTISVPAEQVHEVRLTLMTGDLPLNGGVGFEIFDKQGLGVTEQSQKVSLQRALQGELARTIGTIENVKQVRVHLVLPESTLFTRDRQQASAAVNVTMRPGSTLQRSQIMGVQRLVAAAVPGLDSSHVVITDQRGITLSTADASGVGAGAAEARLQAKSEVEDYVTRKVARLLDSAFGPGQAIVSVDVSLNFDATKTTINDLLPASSEAGATEGRVVRRHQVTSPSIGEPAWTNTADGVPQTRSPGSSVEVQYEYGRRIDEIIATPGSLTRISVGVIVPAGVTEEKRTKIAELVRMAAGINESRGDAVSVQTLYETVGATAEIEPQVSEPGSGGARPLAHGVTSNALAESLGGQREWFAVGLIVLCTAGGGLALAARRRRLLSFEARQRVLDEIKRTLGEPEPASPARART